MNPHLHFSNLMSHSCYIAIVLTSLTLLSPGTAEAQHPSVPTAQQTPVILLRDLQPVEDIPVEISSSVRVPNEATPKFHANQARKNHHPARRVLFSLPNRSSSAHKASTQKVSQTNGEEAPRKFRFSLAELMHADEKSNPPLLTEPEPHLVPPEPTPATIPPRQLPQASPQPVEPPVFLNNPVPVQSAPVHPVPAQSFPSQSFPAQSMPGQYSHGAGSPAYGTNAQGSQNFYQPCDAFSARSECLLPANQCANINQTIVEVQPATCDPLPKVRFPRLNKMFKKKVSDDCDEASDCDK